MYYTVESWVYRSTLSTHFHKNYFFNLLKSTCMQINRTQGKSWWVSIFLQNKTHTNMTLLVWWGVNCSSVWKSKKVLNIILLVHWNHEMELRVFFFNAVIFSQTTILSSHLYLLWPTGRSAVAYVENIHHWLTRKIILIHSLPAKRIITTKDYFHLVFSFPVAECCWKYHCHISLGKHSAHNFQETLYYWLRDLADFPQLLYLFA